MLQREVLAAPPGKGGRGILADCSGFPKAMSVFWHGGRKERRVGQGRVVGVMFPLNREGHKANRSKRIGTLRVPFCALLIFKNKGVAIKEFTG